MKNFPRDVLAAQRDYRQLPPQYLATIAESDLEIVADDVFDSVLRSLVDSPTQQAVEIEVLEVAADEPFLRALADPRMRGLFGDDGVFRLRRRFERKIIRRRNDVETRLELARRRHFRLSRTETRKSYGWLEARISKARTQINQDIAEAEQLTNHLERDLADGERQRIEELRAECDDRFGPPTPEESALAGAVRRALDRNDIEQAQSLLTFQDADSIPHLGVVPRRGRIPYSDAAQIVRWLNGEEAAPAGFNHHWGVVPDDPLSEELRVAVSRCVRNDGVARQEEFVDLAHAIARTLGAPFEPSFPLVVRNHGGMWQTRLPLPRSEGLYAFEQYDHGVLLVCAAEAEEANGTDSRDEEDSVGAEDLADEYYISLGDRPLRLGWGRALPIDWRTLLGLVSDRDRRHGLVRTLGASIHPRHAFPEASKRDDANALRAGRQSVVDAVFSRTAPVLWVGPRGSGRTATILHASSEARERGWHVERIGRREELDRFMALSSPVDVGGPSRLVPDGSRGCLFVVDDVEELEEEPGMVARLLARLQVMQDAAFASDTPMTVLAMTTPGSVAVNSGVPFCLLPPLPFEAAREAVIRLLDIVDVAAEPAAIDHIALASGGHPQLLHMYLRRVCEDRIATRHTAPITADLLRTVTADRDVRSAARDLLFGAIKPIWAAPTGLAEVFAAVWTETHGSESCRMSPDAVQRWLAGLGIAVEPNLVQRHLLSLEASYLLEQDEAGYRLTRGGYATLLLDSECDAFVEEVLQTSKSYA